MVKIIDPTPCRTVVKAIVCQNCGVKLEYVPKDVRRRDGKDYSGGADGHTYIKCPGCNKKVIIDAW